MAVNTAGENFEMPINMTHLKDPNIMESEMHLKMDLVNNNCASFVFPVDIEKGNAEIPNSVEQATIGGKYMQLFMNYALELLKFTSRDNKSRKYKRSASFNARRVVLLFSVLSSMGTIILIYLTLRAKQINDGSGNV